MAETKHHSSHRHSSHHSSSSKSKKKHDEYGKLREFFSFLLFLSLSALVVFSCIKGTVINHKNIAQIFTNKEYSYSLYNDVYEYSKDMCLECNIPSECVEEALTFSAVDEIERAYAYGLLEMDEKYSQTTYLDYIDDLNKKLVSSTKSVISAQKLSYADNQKDGAQKFADRITDYLTEKTVFEYSDNLQTITNIGNTALSVLIAFFAIVSFALALLVYSLADKKYRSIRSLSFSVFGASALNLFLVLLVQIVKMSKELVIFPSYLCESVMRYVNSCTQIFFLTSVILFVIGVMITAFVWKLKRNNN